MQTARPTSFTQEQRLTQRTRWWETSYTTANWDYPPSPAVCYDALLARGASHSRFLRIAYLRARELSSPSAPRLSLCSTPLSPLDTSPPPPPQISLLSTKRAQLPSPLSRPCAAASPRSANPPHTLKRQKPRWSKPPHYHASLLRSPLSRRKGLFRAALPPNKAVDLFRWDNSACPSSFSAHWEPDRTSEGCTSLHVAECVLEPYEAAAGFSGWHGLGMGVAQQGKCDRHLENKYAWNGDMETRRQGPEHDGAGKPDLRREIDEETVDQGRVGWARLAEELVGPPGIALQWIQDDKSRNATAPLHPAHGVRAIFSSREEVRWNPDIGSSPFRPPRPTPAPDEKKRLPPSSSMGSILGSAPGSKPEPKSDSPSAWYAPSSHHVPPPHLQPLRFPHTPHVRYGPPPLQFSPYFPGGRPSAQGYGEWYSIQPIGVPSVNRDSNLAKLHLPRSHGFTTPPTPTLHTSSRHPLKSSLGRDKDEPGHDCDKETETDHGYESTTTTTDSDPPPHTPIGAATTSNCPQARQLHRDDEGVHVMDTALVIGLSDPTTPVKLVPRSSPSPLFPAGSLDLNRTGHDFSKATVVFPSLNGSFRQGSLSQLFTPLPNQGTSTPTTPARVTATTSLSSLSSIKDTDSHGSGNEDSSKPLAGGSLEPFARSALHDNPALTLSVSSPPPTSPGSALRKDSQGFWEPVTPVSPCSSLSSLPVSPSESRVGARSIHARIGEREGSVPVNTFEAFEANGSYMTKSRSLSPGPRRDTSVDSSLSSSSRPTAFSSPTSTPASASVFGGSYPGSPSPSNSLFLVPPNSATLLPAFLATTGAKRKKTSRTREIVDQLRSSSIDAGKGIEALGWLAGPGVGDEQDDTIGKVSDYPVESHVTGQLSPPPKAQSDSTDSGKNFGRVSSSRTCDSASYVPGKSNGTASPETSPTTSRTTTVMTPFPILSVSPTSASNSMTAHRNQSNGNGMLPSNDDGPKANVTVTATTSPNTRSQFLPDTPNGTSPSTYHSHHPLPSPSHPTVHLQPVLGPPMVAVSAYPPPMYMPYTQYRVAPPHQGQQAQGAWMAIYPGRPAHIPVHPITTQAHVPMTGMRHVSW